MGSSSASSNTSQMVWLWQFHTDFSYCRTPTPLLILIDGLPPCQPGYPSYLWAEGSAESKNCLEWPRLPCVCLSTELSPTPTCCMFCVCVLTSQRCAICSVTCGTPTVSPTHRTKAMLHAHTCAAHSDTTHAPHTSVRQPAGRTTHRICPSRVLLVVCAHPGAASFLPATATPRQGLATQTATITP